MNSVEIDVRGETRQVRIEKFPAFDGWMIQSSFLDFAASTDHHYKRQYILQVLSYAKVELNGRDIPLTTDALIDNHLDTWENINKVFEAILMANGIDPKTHANKPGFWSDAGATMAISFMAEITKLMGPALNVAAIQEQKVD